MRVFDFVVWFGWCFDWLVVGLVLVFVYLFCLGLMVIAKVLDFCSDCYWCLASVLFWD